MNREEREILLKSAQAGNPEARTRLVEENTGLIYSILRRFRGRGCEMEDLFQIGSIGLLKAIDKFDFSFRVEFSTYAVPLITGEIKRFLRDDGMIRVSRGLKETAMHAGIARQKLQASLGREPTIREVAERLHLEEEEVAAALAAGGEIESLSSTIYQRDGSEISLLEKLPLEENACEKVENRLLLRQLLQELPEREKQLILLRYFSGQTQKQVAERLGMTQVQVSRLEKRILTSMRSRIL